MEGLEREVDADLDDELAALALMGDPDQPLDPDAVPISLGQDSPPLLPEWYMPAPAASLRRGGRRWVVGGIVLVLLIVNAAGLCVTYGIAEIAW